MTTENLTRPSREAVADVVATLSTIFGNRATTNPATRDQHSRGEGLHVSGLPDIVVFPETSDEVATILALCNAHRVPVVPFGAGSSLEGQLAALAGGVSIDTVRFDKVLNVSGDSMDCRVGAGITREAVNAYVKDTGLFFLSTPARMPASVAWPPPEHRAPMPCATAPCAKIFSASPLLRPMAAS